MVSTRNAKTCFAICFAIGTLISLPPAPARAADEARAAALFPFCGQCHGAAGAGNQTYLAPAIAGLPEWYVFAQLQNFYTGQRGRHPDDVAGLRMYPMAKTFKGDRAESDMHALAAYVAKLPSPTTAATLEGGDAARGAGYYQVCIACHGPAGKGNEALRAPPIDQQHDWYLLSSLQRYKSGVRASDPRNSNAKVMQGMSGTLVDEQAMKDVIAYIRTLGGTEAAAAPTPEPATEVE